MTQPDHSIVYVSCSKGACIEVLALCQHTGALSRIETIALPGSGMPIAIAPDRRHLYAAVSADVAGAAEPRYAVFTIDQASGRLQLRDTIKAPGRMSFITVDHSGRHLLGASVANDLIASTAIEPDGTLRAEPTTVQSVPSKAHQITTDGSNTFAYVPNLGADLVMQLRFDAATGRFSDNEPKHISQPQGAAPRHLAHHPNGRFAYLLNEEDGSIAVFRRDSETGTLTQLQTSDFLPDGFSGKPWGAQILVTPDGMNLYASDRTSSTITLHHIDSATGLITKRGCWPTERCPRNFALHPNGRYLIAAGEASDQVACYAINDDAQNAGALILKSTIKTGAGPLWVEVMTHV